ncbi:MAG: molybdopterin molybdotransferase [Halothiobacillaceae bacterium]|nr:MAG: molybdopterin molybdotransferase [Halothiobacillaceae bacterium]
MGTLHGIFITITKRENRVSEPSPLREAQERFIHAVPLRGVAPSLVAVEVANGRTLYHDVVAPIDMPPYARVIVEGFLIRAADSALASEENVGRFKIVGEVKPGDSTCPSLGAGEALRVATGSIASGEGVAVVRMWEAKVEGDTFTINRSFLPNFFIEAQGCDLKRGSTLLKAGTR